MVDQAVRPKSVSKFGQGLIGIAPIALLAAWFAGGTAVHDLAAGRPAAEPTNTAPDGRALFVRHCAYCHGETGNGKGIAGLNPLARYFGRDKYKFTTTRKGDTGGVPTDDDLLYILRHGIPGTAMWGFADRMTEDELRAVVAHLRTLTRAGLAERQRLYYEKNEDDPDWKKIAEKVEEDAQVGEPVPLPKFSPATPESVERGRQLFVKSGQNACASCHGTDGRGGPTTNDKTNDPPYKGGDGRLNRPRDLTTGIFKGGAEKERLYPRILLGIPGTPMPPGTGLSPRDVEDLIDFILSLKSDAALASHP